MLSAFSVLGVTSFGGPIAHLGYFRAEVVTRRRWLGDGAYGDLVALAQFLPGPASSQVGFGLGLLRAGPLGALVAFVAFTLPSALVMFAVATGVGLVDGPVGSAIVTGLKIGAVAIVAHAVMGMCRTLAPDRTRSSIAVAAAVLALTLTGPAGQLSAIALGVLAGFVFCRTTEPTVGTASASPPDHAEPLRFPVTRSAGVACLAVFATLLVGLPVLAAATGSGTVALVDVFYRAGALVFGGGHVVLPLLHAALVEPGLVDDDTFLTGYAAAQAVPGPLFTFATYLGAVADIGPGGALGAALATVAIFAPGLLLLVGVLPFWNALGDRASVRALMRGANAAVVGLLAAALYDPVVTTAITGAGPFCLALVCFVLLVAWRTPPWAVVAVAAAGGLLLAVLPG
ncbi:chromate efflux transporter [Frigoribacterium sp. RIT-PI-h]|uniref:chromate efflux transporter n=1 Tax=Frigoribacterium sp. RIT-PI-h TaxID=1690245 RepID=UPI0006B8F6C3|nr:chromate efflux transporter [Frigoribacterium sp. RIT-PI-h]KPG87443.1 chromate transporter [Frigoribacterium sp. RIT-PI-h]